MRYTTEQNGQHHGDQRSRYALGQALMRWVRPFINLYEYTLRPC